MERLLDFDCLFKVVTDASHYDIRGVLLQESRPLAFESRKLNSTSLPL